MKKIFIIYALLIIAYLHAITFTRLSSIGTDNGTPQEETTTGANLGLGMNVSAVNDNIYSSGSNPATIAGFSKSYDIFVSGMYGPRSGITVGIVDSYIAPVSASIIITRLLPITNALTAVSVGTAGMIGNYFAYGLQGNYFSAHYNGNEKSFLTLTPGVFTKFSFVAFGFSILNGIQIRNSDILPRKLIFGGTFDNNVFLATGEIRIPHNDYRNIEYGIGTRLNIKNLFLPKIGAKIQQQGNSKNGLKLFTGVDVILQMSTIVPSVMYDFSNDKLLVAMMYHICILGTNK